LYAGAPLAKISVPTVDVVLKLMLVMRDAPNSAVELMPEGGFLFVQLEASVQSVVPVEHSPAHHFASEEPGGCDGPQLPPP
jgi:hypothetical protein